MDVEIGKMDQVYALGNSGNFVKRGKMNFKMNMQGKMGKMCNLFLKNDLYRVFRENGRRA